MRSQEPPAAAGNNDKELQDYLDKTSLSVSEIDGLVYSYLKARGYHHALQQMKSEKPSIDSADLTDDQVLASQALHVMTDRHTQMLHSIYGYTHSDNNVDWFHDSYQYLYLWINQCLDCYRIELHTLLYPIFVHFVFELLLKSAIQKAWHFYYKFNKEHNTLHSQDLSQLYELIQTIDVDRRQQPNNRRSRSGQDGGAAAANDDDNKSSGDNQNNNNNSNQNNNNNNDTQHQYNVRQIEAYPIYQRYRKYKYQLSISQVSHNLFMSWLNTSQFNLLRKTVNNHIDFKIVSYKPSMTENAVEPPLGMTKNARVAMNKSKVQWGISRYIDGIETKALKERDSSAGGIVVDHSSGTHRLIRTEFSDIHPSQPKLSKHDEQMIESEIKSRVYAGPDRLPSICAYKFIHAAEVVSCCNVSTNGRWIVAGCNDATLRLFDVAAITAQSASSSAGAEQDDPSTTTTTTTQLAKSHCHRLVGHKSSVTAISFYPDRDFFVSSSTDNSVRLWSTELGDASAAADEDDDDDDKPKSNSNSKQEDDDDEDVDIQMNEQRKQQSTTRTEKGSCLAWYRGHCFPIWDVEFSPLGLYFATASHDRTARLWSTDKGVPLRIFAGHLSDVECVRFHPNCNYVLTGSSDRTIRMWDIQSGNCVRLMSGHLNTVNDLQVTSDGRCIVSASQDKTIRVWDIATAECISVLHGHSEAVTKIALAHSVNRNAVIIESDEQSKHSNEISSFPLIVSSSMDNTVRFWNVNDTEKALIKTIPTNICASHLEMTRSNLLMLAGTV